MKLETARAFFLVGALGLTSLCIAAWHEPGALVVGNENRSYCPLPPVSGFEQAELRPDHDLLLFLYSLSQGTGSRG
ncbi:hypothetical protein [Pseudomonas lopnurensis]|uniref:hypothetical protein n=1 Tax=Pseudomonas lopnurensis TaxID=1477517 RepID=UPI00187A1065|nr:hypothetical protein [Pseudomonas lopnurensis]MBE7376350.1 hypothetical protein [Pseudomonas lopnurensis]